MNSTHQISKLKVKPTNFEFKVDESSKLFQRANSMTKKLASKFILERHFNKFFIAIYFHVFVIMLLFVIILLINENHQGYQLIKNKKYKHFISDQILHHKQEIRKLDSGLFETMFSSDSPIENEASENKPSSSTNFGKFREEFSLDKIPILYTIINSKPENIQLRNMIRKTWTKHKSNYKFFVKIADPSLDKILVESSSNRKFKQDLVKLNSETGKLIRENQQNFDIIIDHGTSSEILKKSLCFSEISHPSEFTLVVNGVGPSVKKVKIISLD